jgi:hypothetical protein
VAAETGFLIDGTIYEVPALDSFTLDEEQVLYDWCQLVQEDFMSFEGETDEEYEERRAGLMRRPGFWAAWMQIAYQRANPKMKPEQVRQLIGTVNRQDALSALGDPEDEETDEVRVDERAQRIIGERLARQRQLDEGLVREFWDRCHDRLGRGGRRPCEYWSYEIGHILHLAPSELGGVRRSDLMGAVDLFDAKYRAEV